MKHKVKKYSTLFLVAGLSVFLAACSNAPLTKHSTGLWDKGVLYTFSQAIVWLSQNFGGYGIGIILFTILVRIVMLPLMVYQARSMRKTQEIQPQMKALQKKYASKDTETVRKLQTEQQALYKEAGINPWASMLPLLIQLPIIFALYQAILRTNVLRHGTFLWLQLGSRDPYFVLPILAAIFTYASSWLTQKSQLEQNGVATMMTWVAPIIIFFTAMSVPSALSLYWVVTNAFQVVQTLLIQNPFKINRERAEKAAAERARKRKIEKAKRKAVKSKKR